MPEVVLPPPPAYLSLSNRAEERPPAGPPSLVVRGDLRFVEGVHGVRNRPEEVAAAETSSSLPQHNPADRDYTRPPTRPSTQIVNETRPINEPVSVTKSFLGCLKPNQAPLAGLRFNTLLLFAIQLIVLGATIAVWVVSTIKIKAKLASKRDSPVQSISVFIHLAFGIMVVGQLVLLHRQISSLRRERHHNLHPGEGRSRHRQSHSSVERLTAMAPWNRPPLPTYRSALAQSGVATGDVEDNLIAIPPPPAYGNVRESTLITSSR